MPEFGNYSAAFATHLHLFVTTLFLKQHAMNGTIFPGLAMREFRFISDQSLILFFVEVPCCNKG